MGVFVGKRVWLIAVALLLAIPSAAQYRYDVNQDSMRTYATELFGEGSDTVVINNPGEGGAPELSLTLWIDVASAAAIDSGDTAEVTMSLANATFASSVRSSHLNVRIPERCDDTVCSRLVPINIRGREGSRGASTVTFEIVSTGTLGTATGTIVDFVWDLPPLMGLSGTKNVTASVTVDAGGGSGFKSSDAEDVTVGDDTHKSSSGVMRRAAAAVGGVRASVPLINFKQALNFAAGGGGTANIDLNGDRTQFRPWLGRTHVLLADVTVGADDAEVLQIDGETFSIANRQDGDGDLVISVTGEFHQSGDEVWLDIDRDHRPDGGEMLSASGGVMSGRFKLNEVAGNAGASDSNADEQQRLREEGSATRNLLYRPNGTDVLRPATYTSTFIVDYVKGSNVDRDGAESKSVDLVTSYTTRRADGASHTVSERMAAAVPPVGSAERGNVRVKCETAVPCTLYLECDDGGGETWFVQLDDVVPGRSTLRLSSEDIARHIGVGADGWSDRLSCGVFSTQDISVQVLTRSGGILVNNTYVDQGED